MRKFIVSDLHGDGNVYNSITSYLENVAKDSNEEITLYINGDLIDRGYASGDMLLDVYDRITNNKGFKIEYLGGNHELMMYEAIRDMSPTKTSIDCAWYDNGGCVTFGELECNMSFDELLKLNDFIGNLNIYHKFTETLNDKNIVLVHAQCPSRVEYDCHLKVNLGCDNIGKYVWERENIYYRSMIITGNKNYFTIIGHTPVGRPEGYKYIERENYMNIDGGCSGYVLGYGGCDNVPLVEIDGSNNRLIILTFNNSNEITLGNYFSEGKSSPITDLDKYRKYINPKVKLKKMYMEDGVRIFR